MNYLFTCYVVALRYFFNPQHFGYLYQFIKCRMIAMLGVFKPSVHLKHVIVLYYLQNGRSQWRKLPIGKLSIKYNVDYRSHQVIHGDRFSILDYGF